ncbi:MAG: alpha/beta hydrolase fold domain-containing protein [Ignavibacteriales bacterium]
MKPVKLSLFILFVFCLALTEISVVMAQKPSFANIEYARVKGKSLKLDLYLPKNTPDKLPLIVWIHGGGWKGGDKSSANVTVNLMLPKGYAVAGINYRLSQDSIFPAQLNDCKAAIRWLRANAAKYNIDPDRIGVWGSSAGGHLAALLGTTGDIMTSTSGNLTMNIEGYVGGYFEYSSRVQAVCDMYGPTDFLKLDGYHLAPNSSESLLMGGALRTRPDRCWLANPITYISKDDPPFLIIHGTSDPIVPVNQSEMLNKALLAAYYKQKKEVVYYPIKDAIHGGPAFLKDAVLKMVASFFDRNLKNAVIPGNSIAGMPKSVMLHQNYPNPFNPRTVISYYLPVPGQVNLSIFDTRGKEVARLVNRFERPGNYSINFNPSPGTKSGIYYYRLKAGKDTLTRKMLLVK